MKDSRPGTLVDLLKGAFGIEEGDNEAQIIRRVAQEVFHAEGRAVP